MQKFGEPVEPVARSTSTLLPSNRSSGRPGRVTRQRPASSTRCSVPSRPRRPANALLHWRLATSPAGRWS